VRGNRDIPSHIGHLHAIETQPGCESRTLSEAQPLDRANAGDFGEPIGPEAASAHLILSLQALAELFFMSPFSTLDRHSCRVTECCTAVSRLGIDTHGEIASATLAVLVHVERCEPPADREEVVGVIVVAYVFDAACEAGIKPRTRSPTRSRVCTVSRCGVGRKRRLSEA
jgi:hypothetical protein